MIYLLSVARFIDNVNEKIGLTISWALLIAVLICSGNAIIRYSLNLSSNAWLEIQWYLFGSIFLLASSYTLKRNEHVRIDVISSKFPKKVRIYVDIFGFIFFLLPASLLILYLSIPYAFESILNQELSSNAGGLILWPAKILIPIGFLLLSFQGISELIKRIGYLNGKVDIEEFEVNSKTHQQIFSSKKKDKSYLNKNI